MFVQDSAEEWIIVELHRLCRVLITFILDSKQNTIYDWLSQSTCLAEKEYPLSWDLSRPFWPPNLIEGLRKFSFELNHVLIMIDSSAFPEFLFYQSIWWWFISIFSLNLYKKYTWPQLGQSWLTDKCFSRSCTLSNNSRFLNKIHLISWYLLL